MAPSVVGVDFGTLSGRAVVVRASDGEALGSAVHEYAHGVIEPAPNWALQDPEDYLDVLREAVPAAVRAAGIAPEQIVGIATDFTASTPLPPCATARRCAGCFRTARTRSRSCGSTTPRSARPTASTRWPPSAASRGWRATAG
jgi:L-ribulokinase